MTADKSQFASWPSIASIAEDVQSGKTSAASQVELALKRIDEAEDFQTVIAVTAKRAKERAEQIDNRIKTGDKVGPLAGVPFIAKDNFLAFGADTTAASNILKGFDAPYQASAIDKLEEAGAICVAKANLDAFAHGSSTENSDFFPTKNPHDKARVPGGSSGGSTAAVVLGLAPFAIGTDTGGSIRLPAAFSGAVGYKPSYGLVSRSGVVAMASSTDVIGPLTKTVQDAGQVLDVMAGQDKMDGTTIARDKDGYLLSETVDPKTIKVGLIKEYMGEGLQSGVKNNIEKTVEKLRQSGVHVQEISLPSLPLALAVYYIICPAEVSSNLSRYDGQRFGYSQADSENLDDSYEQSRSHGFGAEAKRRIMIGTYVLSSGYYDAYYKKAQQVRTKLINEFEQAFKKVDFLIGPTAPMTAFKLGENVDDPLKMYLTDIMTVAANLTGMPAISIPCGLDGGLPVGLQIIANRRHDRKLLKFSGFIEADI